MNLFRLKDAISIANSKRPYAVVFMRAVGEHYKAGTVVSQHKTRELAQGRIRLGGSPPYFAVCDANDYVPAEYRRAAAGVEPEGDDDTAAAGDVAPAGTGPGRPQS